MASAPAVTCPLCGLRYPNMAELELHARDDHPHEPSPIGHEAIVVHRPKHDARRAPARPSSGTSRTPSDDEAGPSNDRSTA